MADPDAPPSYVRVNGQGSRAQDQQPLNLTVLGMNSGTSMVTYLIQVSSDEMRRR